MCSKIMTKNYKSLFGIASTGRKQEQIVQHTVGHLGGGRGVGGEVQQAALSLDPSSALYGNGGSVLYS